MPDPIVPDEKGAAGTAGVAEDATSDDVYEGAFDEAVKIEGDKADISEADDPNKVKAGEEAEVKVVEKPIEKPVEKPVIDAAAPKPGEDEETYKQRYLTLQGIVKHDKQNWEQEKTGLLSQVEEAKKPKTPEEKKEVEKKETASAEAFVESLTAEQQEQLKEYEADFDVVSKMEGLKRTRELTALRKEISDWKAEVANTLTETQAQIAPVVKRAEESETEAHFNVIGDGYRLEDGTVIQGHPDWEKYRDDGTLLKWIEEKPAYLQAALKEVYEKGTARDIIDLYSDFKKESNIETIIPESGNVVHMTPKRAEKKAALAAVQSRRGAITTGKTLADDYEGAFDEALNK